ncbi:MAG: hypothetical protein ACK6DP_14535 [Gemmatimonas sp.]|jgi:hypothetical protein|uniref:hypothetical protein n=1 Tax=Gemmatimonas sp. TaxID=1962908 RepID=UPI00391F4A3B|nr:hypothetical protein [Gemmatimonadota bacterium]
MTLRVSVSCLALIVVFEACHGATTDPVPVTGDDFAALRVGGPEAFPLGGVVGVSLLTVDADSRCPRMVQCVRLGDADITIGYRFGMGPTVPLRLRWGAPPSDTLVGSVRMVFDSLTPWPLVPGPLLAQDRYVAWLSFRRVR